MKKVAFGWLKQTLYIQALITCISLPILSWHGIPFNPAGIIGTTLFLPYITLFLFLSTLLFFTQLLYIPNSIIATCLNYTTDLWLSCMSYTPPQFTISLARPPVCLLYFWIITTIISIVLSTTKKTKLLHTCTITVLYYSLVICLFTPSYKFFYIDGFPFFYYKVKNLCCVATLDTTQKSMRNKSWYKYQFMPTLIQTTGCHNPVIIWLPRKGKSKCPNKSITKQAFA